MKKIILISLLVMIGTNCIPQSNSERLVESFLVDLKDDRLKNEDLIEKYFEFKNAKSPSEIKEFALPFLSEHLDLIRQKLINDCSEHYVQSYDSDIAKVNSYELNYENKENVYFIFCNDVIVTPILVINNRISSITVYSKTKEGTKSFVMY